MRMLKFRGCFSLWIPVLLLTSCGPFTPRKAQNPESLSESAGAVTPSGVLDVLEDIYNERISVLHLNRLINDPFIFAVDPSETFGYHIWGKQEEIRIATNTLNSYESVILTLSLSNEYPDPLPASDQTLWLTRHYRLSARTATHTTVYTGLARFYVALSHNAEWVLVQWQDFRNDTTASWGSLKFEKR